MKLKDYEKIIIYEYGKVGTNTVARTLKNFLNESVGWHFTKKENYLEYIIVTHQHDVFADIISKNNFHKNPEIENIYKIIDFEFDGHESDTEYMKVIIKRLSDDKFFKFSYNRTEDGRLPLTARGLANPNPIVGTEVFPQTITNIIYK